jgi:hypothetical protein
MTGRTVDSDLISFVVAEKGSRKYDFEKRALNASNLQRPTAHTSEDEDEGQRGHWWEGDECIPCFLSEVVDVLQQINRGEIRRHIAQRHALSERRSGVKVLLIDGAAVLLCGGTNNGNGGKAEQRRARTQHMTVSDGTEAQWGGPQPACVCEVRTL